MQVDVGNFTWRSVDHEPRYLLFGATEMLHAASHFIEQGAAHVQLLKFLIVLMQPRWPQYA